ncbi:zinc knuckle CX2CX4HX4C containing protein [Tanacetum coccineum]
MTGAAVVMGDKRGELKGSIGNEKLNVLSGSMDQRGVAIMREGTATRVNLDESGATCDDSLKVISSPLVSPTATLIMPPRGPYDIDVAATFGVPLTTVDDLHMLINDIEAGKHDELLFEMTNDDRMETLDALGTICNSIQADRNVILNEFDSMPKGVPSVKAPNDPNADDNMLGMVSPSDPIVQSVNINTKSTSYAGAAGASAKDQPKVNSNFRPLVANLVTFLFLLKLSKRLFKEELARIPIWVKLHDVTIQVFEEDGISLMATFIGKHVMLDSYTSSMCNDSWGRSSFARCLIEVSSEADLVDVVTIGIPSLIREDFNKETIRVEYEWRPSKCDKKRKGKSKTNNGGQFVGPSVKQTVRYEPKTTTNTPKKGATNKGNESIPSSLNKDNITSSNSFSPLNVEEEDEEEEVENVYDETTNLFTKTGRSSFTAAAG